MNIKFLPYVLSTAEFADMHADTDESLLHELLKRNQLLEVDWKGEQNKYEITNFITARASEIQGQNDFDFTRAYEQAAGKSTSPGDFIPALIKNIQKELKNKGLEVVQLNRGNDSYFLGLIKQKDSKALKQAGDEFWNFSPFGSQMGEILYTVYCSCGSMNVWQLKRGELLTDDSCQECGTVIFDEKGHSTFEVIKDYI